MNDIEVHHPNTTVEVADVAALTAQVAAAQARAEALAARDGDIETAGMDPEQRREALNAMRDELDDARTHLQQVTDELQAAFTAQLNATRAALAPLQEKAAKLNYAVEAISLYLGSDEQIVVLREGDPAPAHTPITVYQDVAFMDEEMALAAEAMGIADATIDPGNAGWATFDAWLLDSDDHVNQVCPAPRGIVAMRSAREQRRNVGLSSDGSEVTHFLIRNGDQLSWVIASVEFKVGNRLIPERDEFEKFFEDRWHRDDDGRPAKLTPGTPEWDRAARAAEGAQQHYMKIALILQGIVDRSTLLSPLPAEKISFVDVASYDDGHIIAFTNSDALPSGVLPYREWHRRITADLDRGQRVVFGHIPHHDLYGGRDHGPGCVHPRTAEGPPRGVPLEVRRRDRDQWVVTYPRTDEVWRTDIPVEGRPGWVRSGYAPSKGYASIRFHGDDSWVLPIDHPLVTTDALEWYLLSRENRHHFANMVPLLRSALRALRAEAKLEAPFRDLAVRAVCDTHPDLDDTRAVELVDDAVVWYKTKNRRHRPLLTDGTDTAAYTAVVDAVDRRLAAEDRPDDPAILATIDAECPDAMYVGRRPDGTYLALTAADDRDIYCHIDTFSAKQGRRGRRNEWTTAPEVRLNKTIRATDRFRTWPRHVDTENELTGPELAEVLDQLRDLHPDAVAIDTYRYWSWGGSNTAVRVWTPGDAPVIDTDRPLTGANEPGEIACRGYNWTRNPDRTVHVAEAHLSDQPTRVAAPTVCLDSRSGTELWVDDTALAAAWGQRYTPWAEHLARTEPLHAQVRDAHSTLAAAWEQRAVEAEWASFVEKYGAEARGRWETRLKAIRRRLQFPHRHTRGVTDTLLHGAETGHLTTAATFGELLEAVRGHGIDPGVGATVEADLTELAVTASTDS